MTTRKEIHSDSIGRDSKDGEKTNAKLDQDPGHRTPAIARPSNARRNARIAALSGMMAAGGYSGAGSAGVQLTQDNHHGSGDGHTQGDAEVTTRVREALVNTDDLRALEIEVATDEGVVDLSGEVHTPNQADMAAEVARNQAGARRVRNRLRVQAPNEARTAPAGVPPSLSTPAIPAPTSTSEPPRQP